LDMIYFEVNYNFLTGSFPKEMPISLVSLNIGMKIMHHVA
jgi:hypothetical protein